MTAYCGFCMSFAAKFFGGFARGKNNKGVARDYGDENYRKCLQKFEVLRFANVSLMCADYRKVAVSRDNLVYLDPPYEGRTPQSKTVKALDRQAYYEHAEKLSDRATVIATDFTNERGWPILHDFGDTVVRHLNAKPRDGTRELLLKVEKQDVETGRVHL